MLDVIDNIRANEFPKEYRLHVTGTACPVERMLLAENFRAALPGYRVVADPASPYFLLLPTDENIKSQAGMEELSVHLPKAQQGRIDLALLLLVLPLFILLHILHILHAPVALLLAAGCAALLGLVRHAPKSFAFHVLGLVLGWPTPALLLWLGALLPLALLPNAFLHGGDATHALDGITMLLLARYFFPALLNRVAQSYDSSPPSAAPHYLPPISIFLAQFMLYAGLLGAACAALFWLLPLTSASLSAPRNALPQFLPWMGFASPLEGAMLAAAALLVLAPAAALLCLDATLLGACLRSLSAMGMQCAGRASLEKLLAVRSLALWASGIATTGRAMVEETLVASGESEANALALAGALASLSNDPFAVALQAHARRKHLELPDLEASDESCGEGVCAMVDDLETLLGNDIFMDAHGVDTTHFHHALYRLSRSGMGAWIVAQEGSARALFAFEDPLRGNVVKSVKALAELGITPILLSIGNPELARTQAEQCGIKVYLAETKEADLAAALRTDQKQRVGDCALLCIHPPGEKLREQIGVILAQHSDTLEVQESFADFRLGHGLAGALALFQMANGVRRMRLRITLALCALWLLLFVAALFALLPPYIAVLFPLLSLYLLQKRAGIPATTTGETGAV